MLARGRLGDEETELFSCLAYFIWDQRNKLVHEGSTPNPVGVVHRARALLQSFKLSLPQVGHIDRVEAQQSVQGDAQLRWEIPKAGEYKVNWEVCKDSGSKVWYVGVLIRNHVGGVMACLYSLVMALPRGLNPQMGGCIQALTFALELGFLDICLERPHVNSLEGESSM